MHTVREKWLHLMHTNLMRRDSLDPPSVMSDVELAIRLPLPPSSSTVATARPEYQEEHASSLKPVDRGFGAWSFVRI